MLTVGLNAYNHNASASFVLDGRLVFAAEEERFNRIKYSDVFPANAIAAGLRHLGLTPGDVDAVAFCWDWTRGAAPRLRYLARRAWDPVSLYYVSGLHQLPRLMHMGRIDSDLRRAGLADVPLVRVPHHLAHAASAFYPSPHERAAVLSLDGVGEWETTWMGLGEGLSLSPLRTASFPHSLGLVYDAISQYLGFRKRDDAGKVMGLSAYGNPERFAGVFADWIQLGDQGSFRVNPRYGTWDRYFGYGDTPLFSRALEEALGPRRTKDGMIEEHHRDAAAACQRRFEDVVLHIARHLAKETRTTRLCIAGGCALNCLANRRLQEETDFSEVFVFPAAADAGAGAGAAIWHSVTATTTRARLDHVMLGPQDGDEDCLAALRETGCAVERPADLAEACAELLAEGLIVGWVQGRMEFGPRALGHRSLLADPRHARMKDTMNGRVKHRESFRPFAPACPLDDANAFFHIQSPTPWMMFGVRVREDQRSVIPAVTHEDGTARLQTVRREDDPLFHDLLKAFGRRTGVPVLMNTSFNLAGDPVVMTAKHAVDCFNRTGIDALAAGPYLVVKSGTATTRMVGSR